MPIVASQVKGTWECCVWWDGRVPASLQISQENSVISDAATTEIWSHHLTPLLPTEPRPNPRRWHPGSFLPGYLAPGILLVIALISSHTLAPEGCSLLIFFDTSLHLLLFFSWFLPLSLSQVDMGGEVGLKRRRMAGAGFPSTEGAQFIFVKVSGAAALC